MGYRIRFNDAPPPDVVVTRSGDLHADARLWIDELLADERWQPGMYLLIEFIDGDMGDIAGPDVKAVAEHWKKLEQLLGAGRIALVVDSEVMFGMVRMWDSYADLDVPVNMFYDRGEAISWLRD